MFLWLVFSCLCISLCENYQSKVVYIDQGPVRGYKEPDEDIYSFYSIPYAKAPLGEDRFKAPLPPPVWSEILDAVDKEIVCSQSDLMNILPTSKIIKEDCLIANVYVPDTNETNLPVVVYVHGGANVVGWGNMFTPKKLVNSKKVIAITFNYRLGSQGFLCLGTKDVPGNAGMKDQVALIHWVKRNIQSFGGNPDDITVSGFSSGASSVILLMLSKMTQNSIKKVIAESGGSLSPWSVQIDPIENAKKYAKLLKFDNVDDIAALEIFYKNVPYEIMNSAPVAHIKESVMLMAPCIERDIGEERFLDDSPLNILKNGNFKKFPMLYGFTNMDGLLRLPEFYYWKDEMNEKFSDFLPADLQFKNEKEKEEIAERVKRFYFGRKPVGEETILEYIDYFTDVMYAYPLLRSVKFLVQAGHDQIYLYQYSYAEDNIPVVPYTNKRGANHCAQTFGILDGYWNDTIIAEKDVSDDIKQRKAYMKPIWLNFMTTGKPIPEGSGFPDWPPVVLDWSPHMAINRTLELQGTLLQNRTLFWEDIYDKYYRYPLPPMLPTNYRHLNGENATVPN